MFQNLLGPEHDYTVYDVQAGQLPESPGEQDAWLITGSAAGVYDPLPWIAPLSDFLRAARGQAPMVGICFGHQIMAEAFGGKVIKSDKGWGVGLHSYAVSETEPWMVSPGEEGAVSVAVPASHQDQVVEPPPGARVSAASEFTPYGVLTYEADKAMSMQFHPEFAPAYAKALIEARRGTRYTDAQADAAIATLAMPNDQKRLADWISRFLTQAAGV
jgi:GMP synthase-like glutamine amidotransferase